MPAGVIPAPAATRTVHRKTTAADPSAVPTVHRAAEDAVARLLQEGRGASSSLLAGPPSDAPDRGDPRLKKWARELVASLGIDDYDHPVSYVADALWVAAAGRAVRPVESFLMTAHTVHRARRGTPQEHGFLYGNAVNIFALDPRMSASGRPDHDRRLAEYFALERAEGKVLGPYRYRVPEPGTPVPDGVPTGLEAYLDRLAGILSFYREITLK